MDSTIQAITTPGAALVADAEQLATAFADGAALHDREGTFPVEHSNQLRSLGYYGAPVPIELGGRGVSSVHDLLVASSRLARGDASTTIGLNMHLIITSRLARRYTQAVAAGKADNADRLSFVLRAIADGSMIISSCATEPGTDLYEPNTSATPAGDYWEVSGTKIFCTGSPVATHLAISAAYHDEDGVERLGYAIIPANAPGVQMNDDWNALGMRASGSQSISFTKVVIPRSSLNGAHPIGTWSDALLDNYMPAGLFHASPSLGIAEAAAGIAVKMASTMRKGRARSAIAERPTIQALAAENAIDLMAMRSVFGRSALLLESYFEAEGASSSTATIRETFNEIQAAKTFLNRASVRVVDRALTMSGGAGFMNSHPLARLYRDARAGAFMHPLAANSAPEFIGRAALGLEPDAA